MTSRPFQAPASFPLARLRRTRSADWLRRMVREHTLSADDLIWPRFLIEGENRREPVASMPGVERLTCDQAVRAAEDAVRLKIPAIALFPFTPVEKRDAEGREALRTDNLVCRTVRAIKKDF